MGTFAEAAKNQMLNNVLKGTASSFAGVVYAKCYIGDPGSAGTNNAATLTTRQAVTFGTASAGAILNSVAITFTGAGTETISYIGFWDHVSAGNFLGSDDLAVTRPIVVGDLLTIAIGSLSMSV